MLNRGPVFGFTEGTCRGPSPAAPHHSTHNSRSSPFLQTRYLFITSPLHKSYTLTYAVKRPTESSQNRTEKVFFTVVQRRVLLEYTHERLIDGSLLIACGSSSVCDFQELFWLENAAGGFWTQQRFWGQPGLNTNLSSLSVTNVFL